MNNSRLLDYRYIIDGVPMELTPRQLLGGVQDVFPSECIVDEELDPPVGGPVPDSSLVGGYLGSVKSIRRRKVPFTFAGEYARSRIASALVGTLWKEGHFVLDDLKLDASWKWKDLGVGSLSALYRSVEHFAEFADSLFVPIGSFGFGEGEPEIKVGVKVADEREAVGSLLVPDPESWIVYMPFDTSEYRLGGSLLSQALGVNGGPAPKLEDADYFMDCFEVVRELVEDRVIVAAATVGDGGLARALDRMCSGGTGADVDLSDVCRSAGEVDMVRILFSEVPGVVFQIRDSDFDYLDAELLLQDVMYFPLGHPRTDSPELKLHSGRKTGIGSILESLIR